MDREKENRVEFPARYGVLRQNPYFRRLAEYILAAIVDADNGIHTAEDMRTVGLYQGYALGYQEALNAMMSIMEAEKDGRTITDTD